MFCSDKPINLSEKDLLNRRVFSQHLAEAILTYANSDNLTISLCGKWGSGKTSILNMVVEEISVLTKESAEETKPIVVHFKPWNYSDCTQLICQFFEEIRKEIKIKDNEALKTVGKALQRYSAVFEYTAYIPAIGLYLKPLKALAKGLGKGIEKRIDEKKNLSYQKEMVRKALKEQSHKFIIIIDDIDRLNNEQIRLIFQLVNSLAGFPNMIYLLAFDREIVTRALEEEQQCNGDEYLEKIIQVMFEVPVANKNLIKDIFTRRIADIVMKDGEEDLTFNRDYWDIVLSECIMPFINNIRDVNRFVNAFAFKHNILREKTNCIDLLALTILQISAPEIFKWVLSHKAVLTGSVLSAGSINGETQRENREFYMKQFKEVYPKSPVLMLNILQALFPKFSWNTNGYEWRHHTEDELRYMQRVASISRFDRYFNVSLEEIVISTQDVMNIIYNFDEKELKAFTNDSILNGNLDVYIDEFDACISKIPENRKNIFLNEFIRLSGEKEEYNLSNPLIVFPTYKLRKTIYKMLENSSEGLNFSMLTSLIENINIKTLHIICDVIDSVRMAYGKGEDIVSSEYAFVSENDLEMLETLLLGKVEWIAEIESIFDIVECQDIFALWNKLNKDSFEKHIKSSLEKSENVPKYLEYYSGRWNSGKTHGWSFSDRTFQYITKDELYNKIQEIRETEMFFSLKANFQKVAVAYNIWYEGGDTIDCHDISDVEVRRRLLEWKQDFNNK